MGDFSFGGFDSFTSNIIYAILLAVFSHSDINRSQSKKTSDGNKSIVERVVKCILQSNARYDSPFWCDAVSSICFFPFLDRPTHHSGPRESFLFDRQVDGSNESKKVRG